VTRNTVSSTPKTRATTSSGAARCSNVIPETSMIVLPTPFRPSRKSTSAIRGQTATSAIGTP
jgi:hypothetical protein